MAQGVGIVQSLIIVKLLSTGDFGLVGLVTAIGAAVGVYQNLGISSGSTREISAALSRKEAFKIFTGSLFVRYVISLPLVIGLILTASYLANDYYKQPSIANPLRIFALVLFVQALQSVLTSVIQGLKKFKFLFVFQVVAAFLSISIYIPFLMKYSFMGYFYAMLIFTVIHTLIMSIYVFYLFKENIELPTLSEFKSIFKAVFSIGIFVYATKIIFTFWQKIGPLELGRIVNEELLGIFAFALLVSSKVLVISDAVTDVTLPVMTDIYTKSKKLFRIKFLESNSKAFLLITFTAVMLVISKKEIFFIADLIFQSIGKSSISSRYASSFTLMDPLILAFWAYSQMNLLKSGVAVPIQNLKGTLISYIIMISSTFIIYQFLKTNPLMGIALSMGIGALLGYITQIFLLKPKTGFYPISLQDIEYLGFSMIVLASYYLQLTIYVSVPIFVFITYLSYAKNIRQK